MEKKKSLKKKEVIFTEINKEIISKLNFKEDYLQDLGSSFSLPSPHL